MRVVGFCAASICKFRGGDGRLSLQAAVLSECFSGSDTIHITWRPNEAAPSAARLRSHTSRGAGRSWSTSVMYSDSRDAPFQKRRPEAGVISDHKTGSG